MQAREEVERLGEMEEVIEKEVEIEKRDIEPSKRIPEEDYFEIPQIQYPEDK